MAKGQSETRRSIRHIKQKPTLRNDGSLKNENQHVSNKSLYGNPEFMGTNENKKKKKNMLKIKRKTKNKHN